MILYFIPILTALTLLVAAAGIYQLQTRNKRITARLQQVVDGDLESGVPDSLMDGTIPLGLRPLAFLGWILPGQIYSDTLKWELARAGYRQMDARKLFAGARVLSTVVPSLAAALITWKLRMAPTEMAIITLVAAVVGFYLPMMVLRIKQSRRQQDITLSLPDALDLLVICVEAGQGLNAAILKVGKETEFQSKALSDELKTLNNEMRAGITRAQSLRNLALRTGVDDIRALVAVMIQSDRFGTSIAHALRIHANSLRTRRRQRAEERARKTPVKLVFPLVFCIFPELLVVILAPGMLELYRALSDMSKGG
ncbi:MAG: type II secretion system F family protein [Candidatus Latescibacterota bacterium]